jgi:hypothetical protein
MCDAPAVSNRIAGASGHVVALLGESTPWIPMCTRAPPRVRPEIRAISRNRSAVDETACGVRSRQATAGHGFFGDGWDVAVGHHDSDIHPQKLSVKRNPLKQHELLTILHYLWRLSHDAAFYLSNVHAHHVIWHSELC